MIWLKRIGLIFLIIFLGTILDYIVHNLNVALTEEFSYFTHKIFFGTFWGFVGYLVYYFFLRRQIQTPFALALLISAVPAVLLQFYYYFLEHDPLWKTVFFLFVHFFAFLFAGYFVIKKNLSLFRMYS